MDLDATTERTGSVLAADVCIIGAGPAGLTLADALQARGVQVVLLESGGAGEEAATQGLNAGEMIGDPYDGLEATRHRGLGGTARRWNNHLAGVQYAKYLPLDDFDFDTRDWVPFSGWPFGRVTLDPFYQRAHAICALGPYEYRAAALNTPQRPLLNFRTSDLANGVFHLGKAARFLEELPAMLRISTTAMLVRGATVVELHRTATGDRVAEARWATAGGNRGAVRATSFVLACGAIENARLLLLSRESEPVSRWQGDWVGRGFMEHPADATPRLDSRAEELAVSGGFYARPSPHDGHPVVGRIALTPELLAEHRLPNASLRLFEDEPPSRIPGQGVTPSALRGIIPLKVRRALGGALRAVESIPARLRAPRYQLLIDIEQVCDRENRVVLSNTRDSFGIRQAALHWRWRAEDQRHHADIVAVVERALERAGVGKVHVPAARTVNPNAHHHAGTTRMHQDPELGVVNSDLLVHGEENLFVTGSSVFPTSGFANPTLTTVALTLRLADHLSQRQRSEVTA